MTLTLTTAEVAGLILLSVTLAATDAASLSRLLMAWLAKKLGVKPKDIRETGAAVDGDTEDESDT